jgi:hypothetical protein
MNFNLLLYTGAALLTPILATNPTAAIGTNCNIVSNHTVIAGDNLANIAISTNTTVAQLQFVNTQLPIRASSMWAVSSRSPTRHVWHQ